MNCIIKFEKRRTREKFVLDLQEDYKGSKKLLYVVMRNKRKHKTELCNILDRNGKLVWVQDICLRTCVEHFMELLNVQTDSEDITEKNYTTDNSNIPDKLEVNMLDLETVVRQMKNNKSPGCYELTTDLIKAGGTIGTQWLYWVLRRIWTENKIPEDWYIGIVIPIYKKGDRKRCGS
jgi:hypothetical protein